MSPADDPVRSVAAFEPASTRPGKTLREVALVMVEAGCSALFVIGRSDELSIVSERDLAVAIAGGADPDDVWATDVMTRDVIGIDAEQSIADAAEVMIEGGVRHLAVFDEENERTGIVSMRDLIGPLVDSLD